MRCEGGMLEAATTFFPLGTSLGTPSGNSTAAALPTIVWILTFRVPLNLSTVSAISDANIPLNLGGIHCVKGTPDTDLMNIPHCL